MSRDALAKVVQRAISDVGFRRQLNSDPAGALRGFDLSADEMSAIRTGDAGRLHTLGVDQRMSKVFSLGGALASTRMAASDLTTSGSGTAMVDDLSGASGSHVIPTDPTRPGGVDADGVATTGTSTVHAGDDYKFAGRLASDPATVRTGDDWKFTDRAQGSAAPIEGSPEATAAENASTADGMAAYPAHDGLAGPSGATSVRAGDDWARAAHADLDEAGRAGTARLDDASADSGSRLAKLDESFFGDNASVDASAAGSDPGARLAKLDEMFSGGTQNVDASAAESEGGASRLAKLDESFSGGNAAVDAGSASGPVTAYIDESEAYLTKVGYDSSAAGSEVTDAHDRGIWSGDDIAGQASADTDVDASPDSTDGNSITP